MTDEKLSAHARAHGPLLRRAVHNHGIDPSCKESVIGGRLVGACIIREEAELSGGMDLIQDYRRAKGEIE